MRPEQEPGRPLPIRATAIVLGLWTAGLLLVAFVAVPILFSVCGPAPVTPR